jgi:hypothetical protein
VFFTLLKFGAVGAVFEGYGAGQKRPQTLETAPFTSIYTPSAPTAP